MPEGLELVTEIARLAQESGKPEEWVAAYVTARESGADHAEAVEIANEVAAESEGDDDAQE